MTTGRYPTYRPRRMRRDDWSRRIMRETTLTVEDLIWPVFVHDGGGAEPVESMPGVSRLPVAGVVEAASEAADLGIPAIAIFPHVAPALKDETGSNAFDTGNIVCRALEALTAADLGIGLICDAALDPFTSHGHDGVFDGAGHIANEATIEALVEQSLVQARAGCTVIAPSDMMDGRVGAIRAALDDNDFGHVRVLSYAAKYASAFYGPFRDAVGSATALRGDKRTYQMDPANSDEALREVALDIEEGADMVMVKPGMAYLDILHRVKQTFGMPTFAYQVSGEYAMLSAAAENGWLDGERVMMESLMAFKRAGADGILTYFAPEAARWLRNA